MYYQCEKMDEDKLHQCLRVFIFDDPGMRENDLPAIIRRVENVFDDTTYREKVDASDKRWLDDDISDVFSTIINYLKGITYNP